MGRMQKQECLTLYPEIELVTKRLNNEQFGALMRALIQYRYHGIVTEFEDPLVDMPYVLMMGQVDRMEQVKQRNSENARIRWAQKETAPANTGIRVDAQEYEDGQNLPF